MSSYMCIAEHINNKHFKIIIVEMGAQNGKAYDAAADRRRRGSYSQSDLSTDDYNFSSSAQSPSFTNSSADSLQVVRKLRLENGSQATPKSPSQESKSTATSSGASSSATSPTPLIETHDVTEASVVKMRDKLAPPRTTNESPFDKLTDKVITNIFSYLTAKRLCRCSQVCKRWQRLAWQPCLWTSIVLTKRQKNIDNALKCLIRRLCQETPYVCLTVERIILNGCDELTDRGLSMIAKHCPELLHIELAGCNNFTNEGIFELVSRCPSIDYMDLMGCQQINFMNFPSDYNASRASPLQGQTILLRHLDLSDCASLDDSGLRIIATNCPGLLNLYLRRCYQITDIGVQYLSAHCFMVKELSLSDCYRVTDCGMREVAKLESHLRYLSIAKCELITDIGVYAIAKLCLKLRYLNVRGCAHVTDKSMEVLARGCLRLRSLDVGKCPAITDRGVASVAVNCSGLRKLSLRGCVNVTSESLHLLARYCPELQQLNIQECDELSVQAYKLLKKHCRKCIIEHTNPAFY